MATVADPKKPPEGNSDPTKCSACGKSQAALKAQGTKLKPCPCRTVQYCNAECQKQHWTQHKHLCKYNKKSATKPEPKKDERPAATAAAKPAAAAPQPVAARPPEKQAPKAPAPAAPPGPTAAQRLAQQAVFPPTVKAICDSQDANLLRRLLVSVAQEIGEEACEFINNWATAQLQGQRKAAQLQQAKLADQSKPQLSTQQQQQQQQQQLVQQQAQQAQQQQQLQLLAQQLGLQGPGLVQHGHTGGMVAGMMPMHATAMLPGLMQPGMMTGQNVMAAGMPAMQGMNMGLMNPSMQALLAQQQGLGMHNGSMQ
eukprot:TRINITY_DN16330_c0_g1_i1.p2 TRINITY_DN16330_c0_g1~~TRINITY_DN16330_c0_g1_i1.p2  ORF type:complete len:352 (+),score=113.64 TRINITY_DN16330_c0_g1_i1:122-1057(+)